jgi:hypothetical protein
LGDECGPWKPLHSENAAGSRVIQQLAVQDFERHRTVADRDLLGEENRTHAALTQAANQPETARKTGSEMGVDLSHSGKPSRKAYLAQRRRGVEKR